jgi:hypothetical protein
MRSMFLTKNPNENVPSRMNQTAPPLCMLQIRCSFSRSYVAIDSIRCTSPKLSSCNHYKMKIGTMSSVFYNFSNERSFLRVHRIY